VHADGPRPVQVHRECRARCCLSTKRTLTLHLTLQQAVYPIALSIRSTNVYEEKSMGVYDEEDDQDLDEAEAEFAKSRSATQYIG
jgi:hypothetical protein